MNKTQSYASALYAHMTDNAAERVAEGRTFTVWEGFLTKECNSIGIPKGTETRVIKPLEEMGCIHVLRRGVTNYPTLIALLRPPTDDLWREYEGAIGLTSEPSNARLVAEVERIKRQMGGVDLIGALKNLDDRVKALEVSQRSKSQKPPKGK